MTENRDITDPSPDQQDPESGAASTVEELEERGEEVGKDIEDAKSDWESKKDDSSVPGAQPDEDDD